MSVILNNRHGIYLRQAVELAATVTIKHHVTAQLMNEGVLEQYGRDDSQLFQEEWKYYKNIAGEYHYSNQDMIVTSLDTASPILFSKENLEIHTATAEAYQYNTRNYKDLLIKYPDQELLIQGILYPADKQKAIAAENGTILAYASHYIESNEYSLITLLEDWVKRYLSRWENPQYNITDSLYHPVMISQLHMLMVPAILNIRLAQCKTNEAHSFHVFHELSSHGLNQFYLPRLTTKQQLWLYRNINHLETHAGSRDNFTWLVEHLLSERNLPLAEFRLKHGLADMQDTGTLMLEPDPEFHRKGLNLAKSQLGATPISLADMLKREDPIAFDNPEMRVVDYQEILYKVLASPSNNLPTKALESYAVDMSAAAVFPIEWIRLNHWVYGAYTNKHQAYITVNHPRTGQPFTLNPKEGVILYFYAWFAQYGIRLEQFPKVALQRVTRSPKPTLNAMLKKVVHKYMPKDKVEMIRTTQPNWETYLATSAFNDFCQKLFDHQVWQHRWVAAHNHNMRRAFAENVVNDMYMDIMVNLGNGFGPNYTSWFKSRSFSLDYIDYEEWAGLADNIFQEACGFDRNATVSMRSIQKAMLALMTQMSSYSIQFLSHIIDSQILVSTDYTVRVDDFQPWLEGLNDMDIHGTHTHSLRTEMIDEKYTDLGLLFKQAGYDYVGHQDHIDTTPAIVQEDYNLMTDHHIELDGTVIHCEGTDTGTYDLSIPGMKEFFVDAPDSLNRRMRNAWCDCRMFNDELLYEITLNNNHIPYFHWFIINNRMLDTLIPFACGVHFDAIRLAVQPVYVDGLKYQGGLSVTDGLKTHAEIAYPDAFRYTGQATLHSLMNTRLMHGKTIGEADALYVNGFILD